MTINRISFMLLLIVSMSLIAYGIDGVPLDPIANGQPIAGMNSSQNQVADLIIRLSNTNTGIRLAAIQELSKLGNRDAVVPLISLLGNKSPAIRANTAIALGELRDEHAVEPLSRLLNDDNSYIVNCTIQALGKINNRKAIKPLSDIVTNGKDKELRVLALSAIESINAIEAVGIHIDALSDLDPDVRIYAIQALVRIGDIRAAIPLLNLENDPDKRVRIKAIESLMFLRDIRAIPVLKKAINDKDEDVSIQAMTSYIALGGTDIKLMLNRSALYSSPNQQKQALRAMIYGPQPILYQSVEKALADNNREVRLEAIKSLYYWDTKESISMLAKLLETDNDVNIKYASYSALLESKNSLAVEILTPLMKSNDFVVKLASASILARWRIPLALDILSEAMVSNRLNGFEKEMVRLGLGRSGNSSVNRMLDIMKGNKGNLSGVIAFLADNNSTAAIPYIRERLHDNMKVNVVAAISALGRLHDYDSEQYFMQLLSSKDDDLKLASVSALGELCSPACEEELIALFNKDDSSLQVKCQVIKSLSKIGDEPSYQFLVKLLNSKGPFSSVALSALPGCVQDESILPHLVEVIEHYDISIVSDLFPVLEGIDSASIRKSFLPLLQNDNDRIKIAAAVLLMYYHYPDGVDLVIDHLNDREYSRYLPLFVSALGNTQNIKAAEVLITMSTGTNRKIRKLSFETLTMKYPERAIAIVEENLSSTDIDMRVLALNFGAKYNKTQFDMKLNSALNSDCAYIMIAALNAAVTSANKDILQLIKSCINSSDFRVKAAAVRSLGRNGRMASNLIDSALADESPAVRKSAVEALEFADEDNIDNKLTISLNSSDESIVRSAFAVIRARHRESFLKKLLPYTKYSIATIRIEAIDTLLTLDSKDTVLLTDDLLKESDASIRQSVIHLLVIHNTDRIESKIKAMLSGDNEEIKTDVIIALRDSHTHYALPLLIEMIGKENMHIQKEVLATLTNVSGKNYSVNKVDWQNWYTNEYQRK